MVDLEERLSFLLHENNKEIDKNTISECTIKLVEYVNQNEVKEISNIPILDLKHLTKVGDSDYNKLILPFKEYLYKMYSLNLIGGEKIENHLELGKDTVIKMKSHFLSHAANNSKSLYKVTSDENFLKKTIELKLKSARLSKLINDFVSVFFYIDASDCSKKLYDKTKELSYLKNAIKYKLESTNICDNFNNCDLYKGKNLKSIGEYFEILYNRTQDVTDLKKAIEFKNKAGKLYEQINKLDNANELFFESMKSALELYCIDKSNTKELEEALILGKNALNYFTSQKEYKKQNKTRKYLTKIEKKLNESLVYTK